MVRRHVAGARGSKLLGECGGCELWCWFPSTARSCCSAEPRQEQEDGQIAQTVQQGPEIRRLAVGLSSARALFKQSSSSESLLKFQIVLSVMLASPPTGLEMSMPGL